MKLSQAILYAILATTAAVATPFPSPTNTPQEPSQHITGPRPNPAKPAIAGPETTEAVGPNLPAGAHPIQPGYNLIKHSRRQQYRPASKAVRHSRRQEYREQPGSKAVKHSRRHSVDPVQEPRFSSHRNEAKLSIGGGRQHRHTHANLVQTPENGDQEGLEARAFFEVDELD